MKKQYNLPALPYDYDALEPVVSKELLTLHHDKHHQQYIDNANKILEKLDQLRGSEEENNFGALQKELSFNVGGHVLHTLFWDNLTAPVAKAGPEHDLKQWLIDEFGSIERFEEEFAKSGLKVEGSGWVALGYCKETKRPIIMQIEKHNVNIIPGYPILLVLDLWEHAYYLDYQNKRGDFIDRFWEVVNWSIVEERFGAVKD